MTDATLRRHVATLERLMKDPTSCSYNETHKKAFATASRYVARALAKSLGLPSGSYDVRRNEAGIAVSGETTLHGEWIYVLFDVGLMSTRILWRTCDGRKDYRGHSNRFFDCSELYDLPALAGRMKKARPKA